MTFGPFPPPAGTVPLTLPAEHDGPVAMPTGISASSLNAYLTCPSRWAYDKVLLLPSVTSPAAMVGTHVHRVLERVMGSAPDARTLERALAIHHEELERCHRFAREISPTWEALHPDDIDREALLSVVGEHTTDGHTLRFVFDLLTIVPDMEAIATRGEAGVRAYFTMSKDPSAVQVVDVEVALAATWQTPTGPVPVRGVIDRVDRHPDGTLLCWDYKSGSSPDPRFDDGAYRRQLLFYAALSEDRYGELPSVAGLLFLGDQRVDIHRFEAEEVERFRVWVGDVWTDMRSRYESGLTFGANPGPLCGWCPHVHLCPLGGEEVRRRAQLGTGRGGLRADAPARELIDLPQP